VPLINSLGFIIAGILALWLIKKEFNVKFRFQDMKTLKRYLVEGWHIFISRIAVVLYTSSNVFILGILTNNSLVGYYSIVEKIIQAFASIGSILNQVMFPYFSKLWTENKVKYLKKNTKYVTLMFLIMGTFALIAFLFSDKITHIVTGNYNKITINLLKILAFTIVLIPLGGFFTQNFIILKKNHLVSKVTFLTTIFNILSVILLTILYGVYGTAITVLIVQIFQVFINIFYLYKIKKVLVCVE
jgi:PST family polysaccharide transporter